jgi:hypothetical protein
VSIFPGCKASEMLDNTRREPKVTEIFLSVANVGMSLGLAEQIGCYNIAFREK